ncbi:MAG: oligosaccharide flippase family protein [Deltaproteobacteria bacterium]|nr:oligosaccharide flippase family protein [Deltaproteobacteria bacterium]
MSSRSDLPSSHVNRQIAWIGFASTVVSLLDIVAIALIVKFWVSPEQYGTATLAISLFPVLDLATDMGLSSAVIQRDDNTPEVVSTVFWLNLAMSVVMFGMLSGAAPALARLQGQTVIGTMLLAYGTKLLFQNVYFIPHAMMKRELRFKELSVIRIIANLVEFVAKISFAFAGFELWCFVLGPMCRVLTTGIGVQLRHPWRPRAALKLRAAGDYFKFGVKTSLSQILFQVYTNVDYQVVAYYFGAKANGLYRLAYELVLEPVRIISDVVAQVAFPLFARLRTRRAALVEQFIAFTRQNLVVVIPFLSLVMLVGEDLLYLIFGPKWTAAATAARVLCAVGVFRALSFVVPPLLDGIGYPGTTLIYTAVASVVLPAAYVGFAWVLGDRFGFLSVAMAWAVGYPIAFGVLVWLAMRRIGLHGIEYLRRVIGIPLCAFAALAVGAGVRWLVPFASVGHAGRLAIVGAATLGVLGVLLAYFQGISPRSIRRSMSDAPPVIEEDKPVV